MPIPLLLDNFFGRNNILRFIYGKDRTHKAQTHKDSKAISYYTKEVV
jgi:hypothetical protein